MNNLGPFVIYVLLRRYSYVVVRLTNPENQDARRAAIAIVNLKDEPAGSTSNESEIRGALEARRGPLRDEISRLRPDVIVGGNTLGFCTECFDGLRKHETVQ